MQFKVGDRTCAWGREQSFDLRERDRDAGPNETHAGIKRQVFEQLCESFEASRRRANSYHWKQGISRLLPLISTALLLWSHPRGTGLDWTC